VFYCYSCTNIVLNKFNQTIKWHPLSITRHTGWHPCVCLLPSHQLMSQLYRCPAPDSLTLLNVTSGRVPGGLRRPHATLTLDVITTSPRRRWHGPRINMAWTPDEVSLRPSIWLCVCFCRGNKSLDFACQYHQAVLVFYVARSKHQ